MSESNPSTANLAFVFEDLALLYRQRMKSLEQHAIVAANYFYIDFKHQSVVITGTEGAWLSVLIEQQLIEKLLYRLQEDCRAWHEHDALFADYRAYRAAQNDPSPWLKTDLGLQGQHGFHLLEVAHTQPLDIDVFDDLQDTLAYFKHESIRLQARFPALKQPLPVPNRFVQQRQDYQSQEQAQLEALQISFNPELFSPIAEPELSASEDQALALRVRWYEDEEIAAQMGLSVAEVQDLFLAIKAKYQQPIIPQHAYHKKRVELFPHLFHAQQALY